MKARNSSLALVPGDLRVDCTGFQGGKQIQCPVMFVGTLEPAKDFAMVGLTYPVARSHAGRLDCSSTDITSAGLGGFKYRLTISAALAANSDWCSLTSSAAGQADPSLRSTRQTACTEVLRCQVTAGPSQDDLALRRWFSNTASTCLRKSACTVTACLGAGDPPDRSSFVFEPPPPIDHGIRAPAQPPRNVADRLSCPVYVTGDLPGFLSSEISSVPETASAPCTEHLGEDMPIHGMKAAATSGTSTAKRRL
jgi:hypothetical protein